MGANLRLLLLAGASLSMAACAARVDPPSSSQLAAGFAPAPRSRPLATTRPVATTRVALALPLESGEGGASLDQLRGDEVAMPDIAGRWVGVWSGFGVMSRRVSLARAEFSQAGRWGWGKIVLSDTLAADVPAIVTYRGALGVPVIFDVFPSRVVMKHEAGGAYLSAVFRVDGDRMLGTLRGHNTLIVLSRER